MAKAYNLSALPAQKQLEAVKSLQPASNLTCRRHMASLPGVVQALGLSALLTEQHQRVPNGHAAGEHEGLEERNGDADAESLLQPELFVDLRPFYDRAPVTVR